MPRIDLKQGEQAKHVARALKEIQAGFVIVAPLEHGYVYLADAFSPFAVRAMHVLRGDKTGVVAQVLAPSLDTVKGISRDVAEHEPAIALFGGADGMKAPRLFISTASRLLKEGGFLAIEHHEEQGAAIADVLSDDFTDILLHQDLSGRPRFTTAVRR